MERDRQRDGGIVFTTASMSRGAEADVQRRGENAVEHRQHVCKLTFERMLEPPTMLYGERGFGSNYQGQTETLGKHFRAERQASVVRPDAEGSPGAEQLELPGDPD